eukprot:268665_1
MHTEYVIECLLFACVRSGSPFPRLIDVLNHFPFACTQTNPMLLQKPYIPNYNTDDYVNDWTGPCNNQTINADYAQEVTISGIWNSLQINANYAQEINIACSYDQDHVYKENCGDMMLNADNAKNVAFRCEMSKCVRLAINATNAQTVSITSVAGGNCKYMEINAAGAQYLEIIVDPGWWGEAHIYHTNIYCPVNSDYNGPGIA